MSLCAADVGIFSKWLRDQPGTTANSRGLRKPLLQILLVALSFAVSSTTANSLGKVYFTRNFFELQREFTPFKFTETCM